MKDIGGMPEEFSVIGKRLHRPDGVDKATGTAKYVVDMKLPGMLVGKVLGSPYPCAKIRRIDKSKAEKLSGVEAVITIHDVPTKLFNGALTHIKLAPQFAKRVVCDRYVLADKARYVGDGIAAVAAVDESIAEEALRLIEVEYDRLPAVFDPLEAMNTRVAPIHDFAKSNIAQHISYPYATGDVESGFQEADFVVEGTFHTSKQKHGQLELDATMASFDARGRLTVWSQSTSPHIARRAIAELFGMSEGWVKVITPYIGGGFGAWCNLNTEPICVALAQKAGKPVKVEYSREENFIVHPSRQPFIQTVKIGVKKDGTITALQTKIIADAGAYFEYSGSTASFNMYNLMAIYRCPNTAGDADIVYTNTPPTGAFRGFGNPEAMFALEQMIDKAAEKIGMDPMEFRLKNHRRAGDPSWIATLPISSCALDECIRIGVQRIGWKEKKASKKKEGMKCRGIGIAIMSHPSEIYPIYIGHSSVFIKLNADGSANVVVSSTEVGQGILCVLAQIAAEELGICFEDVHIVTGDTDVTLFDIGTFCSRSTYASGNAVLQAAREVKRQVLERAAKRLGVLAAELEVRDGLVYVRTSPDRRLSVAEVAKDTIYNYQGECLNISAVSSFETTAASPSFQAGFAEVEVDIETGEVKVLKIVIAHDIGKAINPTAVEGQLEGAIAQGIGFCLIEDYVINRDTGVVVTDNFTTYKIPSALDLPECEIFLVEKADPTGPVGAKGVGESGFVTIPAAVANAIYDAVGVRMRELPITPEKILEALKTR
jgi:xanthine dehydrogenase molybdenum-binding subunit